MDIEETTDCSTLMSWLRKLPVAEQVFLAAHNYV
jgi:hypothetical protein